MAIGVGSIFATFALVLLAVSRVAFISLPSLWLALLFVVLGGFCNGLNAVTSEALWRKLTTQEQFPEVVGLEMVVGKVTDWSTATFFFYGMNRGWFDLRSCMLAAAILLIPVAIAHWSDELEV